MVKRGTNQLQKYDSHFPENENGQSISKHWFERKLQNGETARRTSVSFSPEKVISLLLLHLIRTELCQSKKQIQQRQWITTWLQLNPRIQTHEVSHACRSAFLTWKTLERGLNEQRWTY